MGIAAKIEKNRVALLRLLFCWLSLAHCVRAASERPLPRRLARLLCELLGKTELATAYLIIAAFYAPQIKAHRNTHMEAIALQLVRFGGLPAGAAVTLPQVKTRIGTLQHILHNLELIAQNIARRAVLIELVQRLNGVGAFSHASLAGFALIPTRCHTKPP